MAQIDLRHADILLVDGYSAIGAINQPGGYPAGILTVAIDGMTTAIANGAVFQIVGISGTYTASASAGGSTPTSVTFSPGLSAPVADNAQLRFSLTGGSVDDVAGADIGDSVIPITGISQALPNGTILTFGNHATVYTITGSTGGAAPTDITVTPVLTNAVPDTTAITFLILGAINKPGTAQPANGDTTFAIDGISKAIPNGVKFKVAGSTQSFTITGTTGGATPTAITFTPALTSTSGLPVDNAVVTISGNWLSVSIGEGNLTFEEKRNIVYVREKKSVADGFVMTGDDEPMEVSLDFVWEHLASDSGDPPTIEEALTQTGAASTWISSGSDACEPYATDIILTYQPPCAGVAPEEIELRECRWESIGHDARAGTASLKGKCKSMLIVSTRENFSMI